MMLTKREKEVFDLLINNNSTREIAMKLGISEKTIRNHISNVMQKLDVKGRAAAVVELLKINDEQREKRTGKRKKLCKKIKKVANGY